MGHPPGPPTGESHDLLDGPQPGGRKDRHQQSEKHDVSPRSIQKHEELRGPAEHIENGLGDSQPSQSEELDERTELLAGPWRVGRTEVLLPLLTFHD